jgi:CBS domain-containing protein
MPTCREVMTMNPTCAVPTDTAYDVARLMRTDNVGSIPVVESQESKRLVGIITDRDLVLSVLAEGLSGQSTVIGDVMTSDPVTCYEDDDMDQALQAMSQQQVRRIPIVNTRNEIVGIIAQADVAIRVEEPGKTAEVVEDISRPDLGA